MTESIAIEAESEATLAKFESFIDELKNESGEAIRSQRSIHHDNWEYGDNCPSCGNDEFACLNLVTEQHENRDGEFCFKEMGDHIEGLQDITCAECGETLLEKPIRLL